ncbi:hypothetical protein [Arcobacter sp.]|uniref:hypothetical protein n=1 Tax=Arcobacter sp. TaxID=1872629 RepID=UPI003D0C9CA6
MNQRIDKYDYLIVRAGIIGMSITYKLRGKYPNATIAIIDKEEDVAIPAFWRENYHGISNFNLKEMIEILYYETKLFILNSFNFRDLAIEEIKNYDSSVFTKKAKDVVKNIEDNFKPMPAGIRAQLLNKQTNELVQDFMIEHDKNATHILNAVSPAFTCSFAFARYVVDKINKMEKNK